MNAIKSWFKSKNITTHSVGLAILAFAFAYNSSTALRDYIATLLAGYPVVVMKIGMITTDIVAAVTLWRNYSHSSSPAGTLATARAIQAAPDAPTSSQVDAATTK